MFRLLVKEKRTMKGLYRCEPSTLSKFFYKNKEILMSEMLKKNIIDSNYSLQVSRLINESSFTKKNSFQKSGMFDSSIQSNEQRINENCLSNRKYVIYLKKKPIKFKKFFFMEGKTIKPSQKFFQQICLEKKNEE